MDKPNKPWAVLKTTRKRYEAARLWKKAGMERKDYEALILSLPEGFVDHVLLDADAERLIASALGTPTEE